MTRVQKRRKNQRKVARNPHLGPGQKVDLPYPLILNYERNPRKRRRERTRRKRRELL